MKIRLLDNYRGRLTDEKLLPPGEYDDSTLTPFLMDHLVTNGHAVWVIEMTATDSTGLSVSVKAESAITNEAPAVMVEPDEPKTPPKGKRK